MRTVWQIAGVLGLLSAQVASAQTEAEMAEVGKRFQRSCMHCHQPPDLQFATDRAWLDQIKRTA